MSYSGGTAQIGGAVVGFNPDTDVALFIGWILYGVLYREKENLLVRRREN